MSEVDLTEKCTGPCNGHGTIILRGFTNKELTCWEKKYNRVFKNGEQSCPVCNGTGIKVYDRLSLEEKEGVSCSETANKEV